MARLLITLTLLTATLTAQAIPPTRAAFAQALSQLEEGDPRSRVLELLGEPGDVRTEDDPGGITLTGVREILRYGSSGHLTCATLGQVALDEQDRVQYVAGARGTPLPPSVLEEEALGPLLEGLDRVRDITGWRHDPLALLQAVNRLHPLGRERALAVLREYLRVTPWWEPQGREGVFLVLRCLFQVPPHPGYMPPPGLGRPEPGFPEDPTLLPRFPLVLVDDIPFVVINGYTLFGLAEEPEQHLAYFAEHGVLREAPLQPPGTPLLSLLAFLESERLTPTDSEYYQRMRRYWLMDQLLDLLVTVYRPRRDPHPLAREMRFSCYDDPEHRWPEVVAALGELELRWDADTCQYTFPDGSILPPETAAQYTSVRWEPAGGKLSPTLTLQRHNGRFVQVTLECEVEQRQLHGPSVVTLHPPGAQDRVLCSLDLSGQGKDHPRYGWQRSVVRTSHGMASITISVYLELPAGEEVQARWVHGEEAPLTSPVLAP